MLTKDTLHFGLPNIDKPFTRMPLRPIDVPTSEITLLSTIHGRDRRQLRNIGKRDLQAAVKYGTKTRGYPCRRTGTIRWKYTYANIVYITDATSTVEVTSYALPLEIPRVELSQHDIDVHDMIANKLRTNPHQCTSHTVVVVDQSGSMRTSDVFSYKSRSDAVFATIALDLVGNQLDGKETTITDCLTLIEMNEDANVVFDREPITNVLFNNVMELGKTTSPRSHGNYLPALKKAIAALSADIGNTSCAALLVFMSDGKPSDTTVLSYDLMIAAIKEQIGLLARGFGDRLTVGLVGFGGGQAGDAEFEVLEMMATEVQTTGSVGVFQNAAKSANILSSVMTSLGSQLTKTRTRLTLLRDGVRRTKKIFATESMRFPKFNDAGNREKWEFVPRRDVIRAKLVKSRHLTEDFRQVNRYIFVEQPFAVSDSSGFFICRSAFAQGAERIVFRAQEAQFDDRIAGGHNFVGEKLVSKESIFVEDETADLRNYHKVFIKTQQQAKYFADLFNAHVSSVMHRHGMVPHAVISFLEPCVYSFLLNGKTLRRRVLVERMLDPEKYVKWNSNAGHVDGKGKQEELVEQVDRLFKQLEFVDVKKKVDAAKPARSVRFATIEEEDEDDDDAEMKATYEPVAASSSTAAIASYKITVADYPQAFSHYTYRRSNLTKLVCDLQGVLDNSSKPVRFEMTDPVIHYAERDGVMKNYGRTDHGREGIHRFFGTHRCSDLCKILGLPSDV